MEDKCVSGKDVEETVGLGELKKWNRNKEVDK